jgi:1,2-diacylglycerol 3-beta-galactosyltransferase
MQVAQVLVMDLGKEYGGWPLNDMERSYKFMVRHARLWKVAFHGTSPRWVHGMYLAALAYLYAKYARAPSAPSFNICSECVLNFD